MKLKDFVVNQGWAIGFAEVRRAVSAGCVFVNSKQAVSADDTVQQGDTIWYGKHKVAVVKEVPTNEV